ncbi:MAG: hypothetical protein H6720_02190 [Sandaracinus sp.]|nr:hypothetical protein [Sandaracinus sp.]
MRMATFVALVAALSIGCGSSSDAEQEQAANDLAAALGAAVENAAAAAEAPAGDADLTRFGLKMAVPAGATVADAIVGEGHMITAPGLVVTVTTPGSLSPESLDAAKEDAQMYSPTNVQEETLSDGFVLTYENTGGMGTNYFVVVRRTIGDKTVMCETTATTTEQQAAAVAACKSLHS